MMKKFKKVIALMALGLTIVACGTNNSKKDEKVLLYNATAEGPTFDPQQVTDAFTSNVHNFITEGLTKTMPDGSVVPMQAKSWEVSKDGLTWTFHLRDDIKWSDGSDVVAADFEYGWKRGLDPMLASEYAFILFPIKNAEKYTKGEASLDEIGVKAVDDKTLVVNLENVTPYFDSLTSFITYMPAKKEFVEKMGQEYALDKDSILYNGPFVVDSWTHGDRIELVKNDKYYNKDKIVLDKVLVKYIKDEVAALNAFNNEELDFVRLSPEESMKYKDKAIKNNEARTTYIAFNVRENNMFKNENLRKAFALAFDKEKLVDVVFSGLKDDVYTFTPANSGFKGIEKDYAKEIGAVFEKYNEKKAKEYLDKALKDMNLKELPKVTLLIDDRYVYNRKIAESLQEDLRIVLGIDVAVDVVTFKERLVRSRNGNFDVLLTAWGADYQDPMTFLDLLASFNGNNSAGFDDKKYDEILSKATRSVNREDRINYLKEAEMYLADKMPIMPLYQEVSYYLINSKVNGIEFSSFSPTIRANESDKQK
ncbi:peptide ABC transporter substrate-binding protein [Oceanivirga miroungae]|uniref:Family 5 extracellular solute-binding protein n=1 Tax=Oceanivirga miroungae TaxID=1130046 RepID=A0A6I8MDZ8_9FUSO|nr:peptide ABC transporter substrate-binding protein [Oceanivirga miroungae]VWL85675.1 family 5 extracellular solute-binding protein [Oceanivirga miroungae]